MCHNKSCFVKYKNVYIFRVKIKVNIIAKVMMIMMMIHPQILINQLIGEGGEGNIKLSFVCLNTYIK